MSDKISRQLVQAQTLARAGAYGEARQILQRVVSKARGNINAWLLLGQINGALSLHQEAERAFVQASRINPRMAETHADIGIALMRQGKQEQAVSAFRMALDIAPRFVPALANIIALLHSLDRQLEALPYLEKWLVAEPWNSSAHFNAAVLHQVLNQLQLARVHYEKVLELGAAGFSVISTYLNLGVVCHGLRDFDSAITYYNKALEIQCDSAVIHYNMGNALKEQGRHNEAIASFERAIELDPNFNDAHSNILFCMNYRNDYDAQQIFERHMEWGARYAAVGTQHNNTREPMRTLRVGYVSADFREHPVGFFMESVLRNHDAHNCEIYCYFNATQDDAVTARLRSYVQYWRQISTLDDDAVAAMVSADGIDILVDLSGHTSGNRLQVFARKPAPVQVTWLGYCNTTGLASIDYLLADANVIPPETAQSFSEQVYRLPGSYICYLAPDYAPAVVVPPCIANGYVTFGCFNNLSKVTRTMIGIWCEILHLLPDAHFVLKAKQLADPEVQQRYRDYFAGHGIAHERVILDGNYIDHAGLLGYYGKLDIALDTYPYSGVTTTCEALWMGVPVVALAGEKFFSRNSAALLAHVGLGNLVADTQQQYIEKAVALACDHARMEELRRTQRGIFMASPLGNAPAFTRNLEAAYREMWKRWCAPVP